MITIDSIAASIEQGLNASASAYKFKFKIFVDAGKFKKAEKTRTGKVLFINSLLRVGESSVIPVQGITVATQSAMLEICVPIFNDDQIDEVSTLFRTMLDGYFAMYKVQSIDGYTVSSTYSLASTGSLEARGNIAQSLTFYVNMEFSYIENGLNSSNCTFTLDGFEIPYSSAAISKLPMTQSDPFSNSNGTGTSVNVSFVRSFDFQLPAQIGTDNISNIIIESLLGDDLNSEHTLTITVGSVTKSYNVIIGQTDISLKGIDNAGHNISLIERGLSNGL